MKKGTTKITESQLRQIIKESVEKVLREGGHLYHKDEDGNVLTNSKETWRGVPGTTFIWHGEWADPKVIYKGCSFTNLDEEFWAVFMEYIENYSEDLKNDGIEPEATIESFEKWMKWMGTDWIRDNLDELVWAKNEAGELNEGFVNNLSQGTKAFFGKGDAGAKSNIQLRSQNGGLNLSKRFNAAKTNYQMTKEGNEINEIIKFLEDMVEKKQLTPQTTIADLIGGNLNKNKYGRLHAMRDNRTSRASKSMNDIYRK